MFQKIVDSCGITSCPLLSGSASILSNASSFSLPSTSAKASFSSQFFFIQHFKQQLLNHEWRSRFFIIWSQVSVAVGKKRCKTFFFASFFCTWHLSLALFISPRVREREREFCGSFEQGFFFYFLLAVKCSNCIKWREFIERRWLQLRAVWPGTLEEVMRDILTVLENQYFMEKRNFSLSTNHLIKTREVRNIQT